MADCKTCKEKTATVPYYVYEAEMKRTDRREHRWWVLVILLVVLLVGSNIAWIAYESQFEDVHIEQENADGYNNYIGNDGDIINGETDDNYTP